MSSSNTRRGYEARWFYPLWALLLILNVWLLTHLSTCDLCYWLELVLVFTGYIFVLIMHEVVRSFCLTMTDVFILSFGLIGTIIKTWGIYLYREHQGRFKEWTLSFELLLVSMRYLYQYGDRHVLLPNAQVFREQMNHVGKLQAIGSCQKYHKQAKSVMLANRFESILLTDATGIPTSYNKTIEYAVLYFHGGGYSILCPRAYIDLGNRLSVAIKNAMKDKVQGANVQIQVFLTAYRQIPEYTFPAPIEDALDAYEHLLNVRQIPPEGIIFAGDSAGAGIVLSTMLFLKNRKTNKNKLPLPCAGICLCPFVDMEAKENESEHCFVSRAFLDASRALYVPDYPKKGKEASPVHCDLTGLPPLYILASGKDTLFTHAMLLAMKARKDQVKTEMHIEETMPHIFFLCPEQILPYGQQAIDQMAAFAAKMLTQ